MTRPPNVFTLPTSLPGLPKELNKFELVALAEETPFFFFQSLQDDNVGFILANPFVLFPGYEFDLPEEESEALGIKAPEQATIFCIVNASRGLNNATVNLLAPVAMNTATGTARQVVLNDRRYGVRHPLPATDGKSAAEDR